MSSMPHANTRQNTCADELFTIREYRSVHVAEELSYSDQNLGLSKIEIPSETGHSAKDHFSWHRNIWVKRLKIDIIALISLTIDIIGVALVKNLYNRSWYNRDWYNRGFIIVLSRGVMFFCRVRASVLLRCPGMLSGSRFLRPQKVVFMRKIWGAVLPTPS